MSKAIKKCKQKYVVNKDDSLFEKITKTAMREGYPKIFSEKSNIGGDLPPSMKNNSSHRLPSSR